MKKVIKAISGVMVSLLLTSCLSPQQAEMIESMGISVPSELVDQQAVTVEETPDPVAWVNSLPYALNDRVPADLAFRLVAVARGWDIETVNYWAPYVVDDIIYKESRFCWNVKNGAVMTGVGCGIKRQGRKSDSGFGQLISIHYKPGKWLCKQEGLCSSDDVTASPWNSMVALVALLERSGKQPWCYSARARRIHRSACTGLPSGTPI